MLNFKYKRKTGECKMDIIEFQNKLKEVQTLALNNGKKVKAALVEKFFEGDDITQDKLQKVYDFLEIQGIHVDGAEKSPEVSVQEEVVQEAAAEIPLTSEEKEFLEEYLLGFETEEELLKEELLRVFLAGNQECTEKLIRAYQDEIVKAAKKLNREDIFFGDLLQEGNMGLLTALERLSEQEAPSEWIEKEIESTMKLFIEEQTQQKKEDNILVEKVRDLEKKVKELTEDEDVKYSVEELAAFLDMDLEEMESVLRLTGDDK